VKITIRKLREAIRNVLEAHGDWANYQRNALAPGSADREHIETMQLSTEDGENELSGHLLDAERNESDAEFWGPVPPKKNDPAFPVMSDPFTNDWNILPRRQ
jgi:hypothetical protein